MSDEYPTDEVIRKARARRRVDPNGWKLIAAAFACGLLVTGYLYFRGQAVDDRTYRLCLAVNAGRTDERLDAVAEFARLDTTLALLHVERNQAIVDLAKNQRDARIARNQPIPCNNFR